MAGMLHAHTVEQVRAAEAELMARLPEGALMQRAAAGLAVAIVDFLGSAYGRRVLLLVGSGDNGGDALWAGAMLARRGVQVEAWLLSDNAHAEGRAALERAGGRVVTEPTRRPEVVVDGIVGIGGRGGLRENAANALKLLHGVPVVAVDTPSGVEVDTGEVDGGHVEAALTVTFGTHKVCHLVDPAAQASGAVYLVDIGLELPEPELEALQPEDVAALLPRPTADAQKYTRGVVGIRAGSAQYPGAALLSVAGAACGLAGMVRYVGDAAVAELVKAQHPEVVGEGRVQAWVVGSGGGDAAGEELQAALADGVPVVVDADALQHLEPGAAAVLTPHAGELAAMLGSERHEIEDKPLHFARRGRAEVRRHGPAQGSPHGDRPARRQDPGQHHRHPVARLGGGRRRPGRRGGCAAGGRPHAVRRGKRRRLAARRRGRVRERRRTAGGERGGPSTSGGGARIAP